MRKRTLLAVILSIMGLLLMSSVALAKTYKFTFEDVELVDGETVVEDGIVEAASKITQQNKNNPDGAAFTNCTYFNAEWEELGRFQSDAFFSSDGDEVRAFCQTNFSNRVQ